jgi:hypothetical protein
VDAAEGHLAFRRFQFHRQDMTTNLMKLAVGCDSIADLESWIEDTRLMMKRLKRPYEQLHTTRMLPRRITEIAPSTSLYWVIKSKVQCRQRLLEIRPFKDGEGISRCHLVLEPVVHPVRPRPMKPFQGWRYLSTEDAPPDMATLGADQDMPEDLKRELAGLGLL